MRGKTIRVKTPICRALRKLNQQEELDEELKLPTHVEIELRPRTNEAWARVQSVAQNPRLHTLLPLQRRLSTLIAFLEEKWQTREMKHCASLKAQLDALNADISSLESTGNLKNGEPEVPKGRSKTTRDTKPEPFVFPKPKMVRELANWIGELRSGSSPIGMQPNLTKPNFQVVKFRKPIAERDIKHVI